MTFLMNAAGTAKAPSGALGLMNAPIDAIMMGTYTLLERPGSGVAYTIHSDGTSFNAEGVPSPALPDWTVYVTYVTSMAHDRDKELWVSVLGMDSQEVNTLVNAALEAGADRVEVNMGCPHAGPRVDVEYVSEVADALDCTAEDAIVGMKFGPVLDPEVMGDMRAAMGTLSFITAINSVPGCMDTNHLLRGMGGTAIKALGLGQVHLHSQGTRDVYGVGGIYDSADVQDYVRAGAAGVQVGTALLHRGPQIFDDIRSQD